MLILRLFFERMYTSCTGGTFRGSRHFHTAAADPVLGGQGLGDDPQIVRNHAQPDPPLHARVPMIATTV